MIRPAIAPGSLSFPHEVARSRRKRLLDLIVASAGLVLVSPLVLVACAAIVLDSGWPPLFAQERIGLAGRPFRMWKFRTMTRGAERMRAPLLPRNEAPFPVFKLRDDPRITMVGRLLRRSSLDELPQLWNVARGEMSLVGPRPPLPEEVAQYDPRARERLSARPGLTCTWQIERRRRSDITFDEWVEMDLAYLEDWSLSRDVSLLIATVGAVMSLRGE
jgi:lipopolysaccharide/colanic/teichoic acid biosynthesis glycosyltransferase